MKIRKSAIPNLLVLGFFCALVLSGFKQYSVWQQVLDLEGQDAASLVTGLHPHALRFALIFPVLLLSNQIGMEQDALFSIVILTLLASMCFLLSCSLSIIRHRMAREWPRYYWMVLAPTVGMAMVMNGRVAIAMFGLSLLILLMTSWQAGHLRSGILFLIGAAVALLFMAVSSGTIMVGVLVFMVFCLVMPFCRWPAFRSRDLGLVVACLAILAGLAPFLGVSIQKNLDFYGGGTEGFVNMVNHGFGAFFPESPHLLIIFAVVGGYLGFRAAQYGVGLYHKQAISAPLQISVIASMFLGVFGYSTLLVAMPAVFGIMALQYLGPAPRLDAKTSGSSSQ